MSHAGHGRTVYSCGHVHSQCRCMDGARNVKTLAYPCASCAQKAAREGRPPNATLGPSGPGVAYEPPVVTPVGNLHDLVAHVPSCAEQDGDVTVWPPSPPRPTR